MSKKDEYLKPGRYVVRVTLRNIVTIEAGEEKTEMDLVDEVANHAGSELSDWEIE